MGNLNKDKFPVLLPVIGTVLIATGGMVRNAPWEWLQNTFLIVFLASFVLLALLVLNYLGYNIPVRSNWRAVVGLLLFCKERLTTPYRVCIRCLGRFAGMGVSILLVLLVHSQKPILDWILEFPWWLHFLMALLCTLPTVVNGYRRRLNPQLAHDSNTTAILFTAGFLAGLGWFFSFVGFYKLLS